MAQRCNCADIDSTGSVYDFEMGIKAQELFVFQEIQVSNLALQVYIPLHIITRKRHIIQTDFLYIMKAAFFATFLLAFGVSAMPEPDNVVITEGEFTYTGIDKVSS